MPAPPPPDPLESLITQASYSKSISGYDLILAALQPRTLFFGITPTPPLSIDTHKLHGLLVLGGFLSREIVHHAQAVGGIMWSEVVTMLLKMPDEVAGIQVINAADDWILFTRDRIIRHLAAQSAIN